MLFVVKCGSYGWICLAFESVCVETQWVFWVLVGFLGLSGFIFFFGFVNFGLFVCMCV